MIDSYIKALSMAQGRKRKLANNTYLNPLGPIEHGTPFGIKLHATDVVIFHADGRVELNSGGWRTVTTKERINRYLPAPWNLYQDKGIWYLTEGNYWADKNRKVYAYEDGITIAADGTVSGEGTDPKEQLRLRKRIRDYCKAYIAALQLDNVPAPSGGDCFGCALVDKDGNPGLGTDHLISHLEENYFVPSLLMLAVKRFPVSQAAMWFLGGLWGERDDSPAARTHAAATGDHFAGIGCQQLQKALQRYMFEKLGTAA